LRANNVVLFKQMQLATFVPVRAVMEITGSQTVQASSIDNAAVAKEKMAKAILNALIVHNDK
jgi:hypothetical protein